MWIGLVLAAGATETCERLCAALDDAEEACEAGHGDADPLCTDIGRVEETCDPEDGGTTETCPTLCGEADRLDDACDGSLGPSDPACVRLDAIARDCEDGTYDGTSTAAAEEEADDDGCGEAEEEGDEVEDQGEEDEDDDACVEPSHALGLGCANTGPAPVGPVALFLSWLGIRARRR